MWVGHVLDHVPGHVLHHMIIGLVTTALQFTIQPNSITWGVAPRLDAIIVSLLLKFLSMIEVFAANSH